MSRNNKNTSAVNGHSADMATAVRPEVVFIDVLLFGIIADEYDFSDVVSFKTDDVSAVLFVL